MYLLLISLLQPGPLECSQVYQPLVNLRALERPGRSRVVVPLGLFLKFHLSTTTITNANADTNTYAGTTNYHHWRLTTTNNTQRRMVTHEVRDLFGFFFLFIFFIFLLKIEHLRNKKTANACQRRPAQGRNLKVTHEVRHPTWGLFFFFFFFFLSKKTNSITTTLKANDDQRKGVWRTQGHMVTHEVRHLFGFFFLPNLTAFFKIQCLWNQKPPKQANDDRVQWPTR